MSSTKVIGKEDYIPYVTENKLKELLDSESVYFDGSYTDEWDVKDGIVTFVFEKCDISLRMDWMLFAKYNEQTSTLSNVECSTLCRHIDLAFV